MSRARAASGVSVLCARAGGARTRPTAEPASAAAAPVAMVVMKPRRDGRAARATPSSPGWDAQVQGTNGDPAQPLAGMIMGLLASIVFARPHRIGPRAG